MPNLFSAADIENIRWIMGFDRLWLTANPWIDSVLTAIQPPPVGSAPTDQVVVNVQLAMQQVLALDGYRMQILSNPNQLATLNVPTALLNGATLKLDFDGAIKDICKHGTNIIEKISIATGLQPLRPFFYTDGIMSNNTLNRPSFFFKGGSSIGKRFR